MATNNKTESEKRIQDNLISVTERIYIAAKSSGRDPETIRLVVVTKKQPLELISAVIAAGATCLGENYAEEAAQKIKQLGYISQVKWHMIGHVQSRKAEVVCRHFDFVHSLDSLKLAEKYNLYAREYKRRLPVLLQFNVSGEGTKSGWDAWEKSNWYQLLPDIESILQLSGLDIRGVMTMPPYSENPNDSRPYFVKLMHLREFLAIQFPHASWKEVSMGMSGDFEVAIQEGATWVRIGQAIFGLRE